MELLLAAPFLCLHVLFVFCVPEGAEKVERAVFTGLGAFVSAALLNAHELVANLNLIIDNLSEECFSRYDTVEAFRVFHCGEVDFGRTACERKVSFTNKAFRKSEALRDIAFVVRQYEASVVFHRQEVRQTDEAEYEFVRRVVIDVQRRINLLYHTQLHYEDTVREGHSL